MQPRGDGLSVRQIELRGVRVHNLKGVDLDIRHRQLVAICGVSGSGKTSLALDTLYAEGQRRYIESVSPYTRQFLDQFEKPAADRITGIPPAIAVTRRPPSRSIRSTVATATETADYLRLLFARIGSIRCLGCGRPVAAESPQGVAERLLQLPAGDRLMLAFPRLVADPRQAVALAKELRHDGFVRAVAGDRIVRLDGDNWLSPAGGTANGSFLIDVVVDRLVTGECEPSRVRDSVETAFRHGQGRCCVLEAAGAATGNVPGSVQLDGQAWQRHVFSEGLCCASCERDYAALDPRLFSFNSPLGACPVCEGFGNVADIDMALVVPDPGKSLREGAIAPWTTPAYVHELNALLALAGDCGIPADVPFRDLGEQHLAIIRDGVPEREFSGLTGFFRYLERHKYKTHVRVFLSRWRSQKTCSACAGDRLRPESLAVEIAGRHIGRVLRMEVREARQFLRDLDLDPPQRAVAAPILRQISARLEYLMSVGLEYLTLDRTIRTLSEGEAQRVALTSALGSNLVNMLYVLDEPSVGLHPRDVERLTRAIEQLRDRHNTVVVVEHEESLLRAADQLIEIGPGAGEHGGEIVFQGTVAELLTSDRSLTAGYLRGRLGTPVGEQRRATNRGWIRLEGARGNNLRNLTVQFPLGVLCVVTGVSGAGKSTLVQDTLYGAVCRRMRKTSPAPHPYDAVYGDGQIDDVVLVDQSPIGRSPRSNPVTYIKAFDEIRAVFASTLEARTHNVGASKFSFNVEGGRCDACNGDGYREIDMQFLADVYMKCPQCDGRRYRKEILNITYRGRNIAEVLEMTVREAFAFFRGQTKVQTRLKQLIEVGLDYLRLGQPANTLSTGEAQRLKLASYMSAARRNRTLFLLDEPTTGLHFADVVRLLDCFDALLAVGHSLVVVEHNLQLMQAADYIIDLGPGAAAEGGRIVATGTPEQVAEHEQSVTGKFLARTVRQPA
ncbi:MAG: excinuclease ABC subunit A [Planctomycetes bacterium]|nr:excinuclease ABC subunit A [Planctomycetota bacterium]